MFVCRMEIRKNKNERILDSNVVSCWLVTDTVVFQLFKRLLLRLMPQWMAGFWTHCGQWVIFKQKAECWWSSPASLWWADKKKYWNSGFCSPPFQPLNQEGTFQMIPVCLFVSILVQIQLSASPQLCLMRKWKPKRVHYCLQNFCHYRHCFSVLSLFGCIIQPNPHLLFSRRIWPRDSSHNLSTLPPACHLSPQESRAFFHSCQTWLRTSGLALCRALATRL